MAVCDALRRHLSPALAASAPTTFRVALLLLVLSALLHALEFLGGAPPAPAPAGGALAPRNLHHLVVATKRRPGLDLLRLSASQLGYRTTVLGANDSRPLGHWAQAFGLKMFLMRDAVAALPPDDWVLFTDAYDVIFQRPAAELVGALEAWEARAGPNRSAPRLLFTAEVYEWPDVGRPYATRHLRLPFLNSGVYAGRAAAVLRAVDSGGYDLSTDDQRFFTGHYFAQAPVAVELDHAAAVFACLAGLKEEEFSLVGGGGGGTPALVVPAPGDGVAGAAPFVLHFNGANGKVHMYRAVAHVMGEAGARVAERAAWEGGVSFILLAPSRELMVALLPWGVRRRLNQLPGAPEAVALLLSAGALWAVACAVHVWRARTTRQAKQKRQEEA